jgi:RNA methyltransferase, TrmH family
MNFEEIYQKSKKGKEDVIVIEGIHAFKHAARFNADFIDVIVYDKNATKNLMREIAEQEDVDQVEKYAREVDEKIFKNIASESLRTGIIALARKPQYVIGNIGKKQIVFIENPRDIDNVGAAVRVAVAFGAGAVCTSGEMNPWHMLAIRAGAGLQWAMPVLHVNSIEDIAENRKIYACDADGKNMKDTVLKKDAILIFGTERDGITQELKGKANDIISIPMQKGVSSMNLATSVSAILYGGNFSR